jgi:Lon protease-like protein
MKFLMLHHFASSLHRFIASTLYELIPISPYQQDKVLQFMSAKAKMTRLLNITTEIKKMFELAKRNHRVNAYLLQYFFSILDNIKARKANSESNEAVKHSL